MISHSVITRASAGNNTLGHLDSYYKDAKDDYYSKENQPSEWQGILASELGLSGQVDKQQFIDLLAGKDPQDYTKQLRNTHFKNKSDAERLAVDLTFSAPKSISIESLVNNKTNVLKAHELAVTKTLKIIEERAQARQRVGSKRITENTGNLAIAKFRHETNRNLDPQLHTHAVIVNLTKRKDGQYRALHNDEIVKHTKDFTKIYQSFLAKELKQQGYEIRITKDGFELAHINEQQIKAFSSRSKEIDEHLKNKGLTRETASTTDKQNAALDTRQRKTEKDIIQVRHSWKVTANETGIVSFKNEPKTEKAAGQGSTKQATANSFENVFNQTPSSKNLFETEYLLNEYQAQKRSQKETNGSGFIVNAAAISRIATRAAGSSTRFNGFSAAGSSAGISGISGISGTGFNRFNTTGEATGSHTKGQDHKGRKDSQTITGAYEGRKTAKQDQHSGHRSSGTIFENGFKEKTNFTINISNQYQRQYNSERTEDIGDSMRTVPSFTMANFTAGSGLLLPTNQEIQFFEPRAEHTSGLRGSESSVRHDERRIDDDETLDDILDLDYELKDSLSLEWKAKLDEVDADNLNISQLYVENIEDLKKFAVDHLTDKDHIIEHESLKNLIIDKGLGLVDYDQVDLIIDEMLKDKQIIKTDAMYKLDGKIYTEYNLRDHLGLYEDIGKTSFNNFLEERGIEVLKGIYTTQRAIDTDKNIIGKVQESKNTWESTLSNKDAVKELEKTTLNKEQKDCAKMILTTTNAVVGIQGYAGTGKSFMVSKTKEILEDAGKELFIFAPYSAQVKNLQADGLEANTVAKFLLSKKMQEELSKNSVIVIDESGVLNSKQMNQILNLREKIGCQLVLLGDTAQTKAVEAGTPFELMQRNGMQTAEMKDIQRQKDGDLRQSVVSGIEGNYKESVDLLKNVWTIKDREERHSTLVKKYISMSETEKENTLIVSGTNKDRASINDLIRSELGIKGEGISVNKLNKVDLSTKAEANLAIYYDVGNFISFNKVNKKDGIDANKNYEIKDRDCINNTVDVINNKGELTTIKIKGKQASAYSSEEIELSVGDKIRVTKTDKAIGLSTGDLFEVKSISKDTGEVYAEDKKGMGYTFKNDNNHHIDHAYAMTVHASQGLTYDNVICDFNTKSRTLSQETYYVGVSRARDNAYIFTDDLDELPNKISQTATKHNAIDLLDEFSKSDNLVLGDKMKLTDFVKDNPELESLLEKIQFYQAQVDDLSTKGDKLLESSINLSDEIDKFSEILTDKFSKSELEGIFSETQNGYVALSKSAKEDDKWQVTYFDDAYKPNADSGKQDIKSAVDNFVSAMNWNNETLIINPNKAGIEEKIVEQTSKQKMSEILENHLSNPEVSKLYLENIDIEKFINVAKKNLERFSNIEDIREFIDFSISDAQAKNIYKDNKDKILSDLKEYSENDGYANIGLALIYGAEKLNKTMNEITQLKSEEEINEKANYIIQELENPSKDNSNDYIYKAVSAVVIKNSINEYSSYLQESKEKSDSNKFTNNNNNDKNDISYTDKYLNKNTNKTKEGVQKDDGFELK